MTKFYSFIAVALCALIGVQASAQLKIRVIVDDIEQVTVCNRYYSEDEEVMDPIFEPYEYDENNSVLIECENNFGYAGLKFDENHMGQYEIYRPGEEKPISTSRFYKGDKYGTVMVAVMPTSDPERIVRVRTIKLENDGVINLTIKGDPQSITQLYLSDGTIFEHPAEGVTECGYCSALVSTGYLVLDLGKKPLYKVTFNGEEINATTLMGDFYQYNIFGLDKKLDNELVVIVTEDAAVSEIAADQVVDKRVYNLQGVLVSENGTEGLPKGFYINARTKVVVK